MQPRSSLPDGYRPLRTLDLAEDRRALIGLNLLGALLLVVFGWLFLRVALVLAPQFIATYTRGTLDSIVLPLPVLLGCLLGVVAMVVLHELAHGLGFWLFTRQRPTFGFTPLYAYAAAPAWYLPRNQYLVVGLAPLVLLTLGGLALLPVVPVAVVPPLLVVLTCNAAGAVGDLIVVGWLLTQPATVFVRDNGDTFTIYGRAG